MYLSETAFLIWILLVYSNEYSCEEIKGAYRLPKSVVPVRYVLTMEPRLDVEHYALPPFNGNVAIEIKALENTEYITFHIRNLDINENTITVINSNGSTIDFYNTKMDKEKEIYTIHLNETLRKEETYNLTIGNFNGTLTFGKDGFYLAKYKNLQGQQRYLATTDFEPSDARQAFPCFDEPAMKAKFIIHIIRPKDYISVSNEALISTEDLGNGRFQDTFGETVPMSTYLVAFVVCDYKHTGKIRRLRVLSRPEVIDDGRADYISLEATKLLEALEDFTGINYTLSKMDLLAVPHKYFEAGAMENWGLVIFNEEHLLFSNTSSTTEDLQRCATYTAHELAHQWFGNLVTPKWWKYMWLSEGFAAYFQYHISDVVEPSWRLKEQYVVDHFYDALQNDIDPNTEPMNSEPSYYTGLPNLWIQYYKACAVIRMAEHFLSHSIFKKGLRIYLQENKFGAAEPSQVYSAFQQAVDEADARELLGNLTVPEILSNWDSKAGFPLVTVSRNYETGVITLSQKTYRENGRPGNVNIWYIPITYIFQFDDKASFHNTKTDLWFTTESLVISNNFSTDGWLILNKQQTGYYRVNYDISNWQRIINFLNTDQFKSIHPINRAQLIDDAFNLAKIKQLPYEIPLNLSKYLVQENDLIPIVSFLRNIQNLNVMLSVTKEYDIFQTYVKNSLSGALNHLGFEEKPNDTHTGKLTRMNIVKQLCHFDDPGCRNAGLEKLKSWKMNDTATISPDLEHSLLCGAMQIAQQEDWNFLYQKYNTATDINQKTRYMKALGCAKDKKILNNFVSEICNKNSSILASDRSTALINIVEYNYKGKEAVLEYLKANSVDLDFILDGEYLVIGLASDKQIELLEALRADTYNNYSQIHAYLVDSWEKSETVEILEITEWLLDYNKNNIENFNVVEF